jgi:hypothetical protein
MSSLPAQVTLIRYAYLPQATLGRLVLPGVPFALYTLERPWIQNPAGPAGLPERSCVPDGIYTLHPHDSEKHPGTYLLEAQNLGVYETELPAGQAWGRTEILIHKANQVDELLGCIGVGCRTVIYNDTPSVLRSSDALDVVRSAIARDRNSSLWIRPSRGTRELELLEPPNMDPRRNTQNPHTTSA